MGPSCCMLLQGTYLVTTWPVCFVSACLPASLCPSVEACKVQVKWLPVCLAICVHLWRLARCTIYLNHGLYASACLPVCLSAWPSVCLSVSVCLSICFPALPLCQAELRQGCRLLVHLSFCWNKRLLELIRAVFSPQLPLPTQCLSAPMTVKHHPDQARSSFCNSSLSIVVQ